MGSTGELAALCVAGTIGVHHHAKSPALINREVYRPIDAKMNRNANEPMQK